MNEEAVKKTLAGPYATYYSRSRQQLWVKGETSGHRQEVVSVRYDCDCDALLLTVRQSGPACHTGNKSCFYRLAGEYEEPQSAAILGELWQVIRDRAAHPKEGSYTNRLLDEGVNRIAQKVGEEAVETVIGAVKQDPGEVAYEAADMLYHLWVLLAQLGMRPNDIYQQLRDRR